MSPARDIQPTAFAPKNAIVFGFFAPRATLCRSLNSVKGNETLRTTCHAPLVSRSQSVRALRSASSRNRDAIAFEPLRKGVAPTIRELLEAPLIWSFTVNVHVLPSVLFASDLRITARTKFFCASNNSFLPSPSTSAALIQG